MKLPQYYQVARGDSAIKSGISILPIIMAQIVTSFSSGFLVSRYSCYRLNLIFGYALWTIASGLLTQIKPDTSDARLIGYQVLSGFGSGQTTQTSLVAIQAAVKRNEMAVVTGARNYLRMLGSTLAVAVSATIVNNVVRYVHATFAGLFATRDHDTNGPADLSYKTWDFFNQQSRRSCQIPHELEKCHCPQARQRRLWQPTVSQLHELRFCTNPILSQSSLSHVLYDDWSGPVVLLSLLLFRQGILA